MHISYKPLCHTLLERDMINPTILAWGLGDENYLFYLATGDTVYALDKKSLIPGQEPVTKLIVEAPNDIFYFIPQHSCLTFRSFPFISIHFIPLRAQIHD